MPYCAFKRKKMKERLKTAHGVLLEIGFSCALILAGFAVSKLLG